MKKYLSLSLVGVSALLFLVLFFTFRSKGSHKPWMDEQIQADLILYSKEDFKPDALRRFFDASKEKDFIVYYQIKNGKLYFKRSWDGKESFDRVKKTTRFLNHVASRYRLPDMEWVLTVHDGLRHPIQKPDEKGIPIFCYAKTKGGRGVLFPDPLTEDFARRGRKSLYRSSFRPKYQWRNKKKTAFWRGGTTGDALPGKKAYDEGSWFKQPRTQLSLLSEYYPGQIDAGFTSFPGLEASVFKKMTQHIKPVNWTNHKDHLLYKYLVIPDGNTCTYPRYYLALYSNSVAFKQKSTQIQWFYGGLKAGVHFVEVANDFSDLPEKVAESAQRDSELKKIARQGTRWIKRNLMPRHIQAYAKALLLEYAKKQHTSSPLMEDMQTYEDLRGK